jgi:hypothetical protein
MRMVREDVKKERRRWAILIPMKVLMEFREQRDSIRKFAMEKKEGTFLLSEDFHCKVSVFKGLIYVGFGRVDGEGKRIKGAGMKLDVVGFESLLRSLDNIIESMLVSPMKKLTPFSYDSGPIVVNRDEGTKEQIKAKPAVIEKEVEGPPTKRPRLSVKVDLNKKKPNLQVDTQETNHDDSMETPPSTPGSMPPLEIDLTSTPEKSRKTIARRPQMKQFKYKWVSQRGKPLSADNMWHFSEADCLNQAMTTQPVGDSHPHLEMETRHIDRMTYDKVLECFLIEVMAQAISDECHSRCQGCLYEAPGQAAHMEGGCLTDWEDVVQVLLCAGKEYLKVDKCKEWGRYFLEILGYPVRNLDKNITDLIEQWGDETLIEKLKEKNVGDNIIFLINRCKPV